MVFSSTVFLFMFLPIVILCNLLVKKEYSNYILLIASLFFYSWGEPYFVFLMLLSIIVNWFVGITIEKAEGKDRKKYLILGIIFNLSILCFYKYTDMFPRIINDIWGKDILPVLGITLPIGISFFTFQAISYIVDIYKHDTEASASLVNVALYISFFPQLIAGPIVKYKDINEQIQRRSVDWKNISDGFKRFIYGLGKKVLIANTLGECVDIVFAFDLTNLDTKTAWIGAIAYSFQIYYDFSGYSDMAIGLANMFGFSIKENFNYPYLAKSISEFWRRWHISLGSWFREYVYFPMGGNRKGKIKTYTNLLFVFFLTGLWHGADLSFVVWGLYHGVFVIIERLGFKKVLERMKCVSVLYTFFVVSIGWVLFRAENTIYGIKYLSRMMSFCNNDAIYYFDKKTIFTFACAILGMGSLYNCIPKWIKEKWNGSIMEAIYCLFILILSIASIAGDTYNPFIYFHF